MDTVFKNLSSQFRAIPHVEWQKTIGETAQNTLFNVSPNPENPDKNTSKKWRDRAQRILLFFPNFFQIEVRLLEEPESKILSPEEVIDSISISSNKNEASLELSSNILANLATIRALRGKGVAWISAKVNVSEIEDKNKAIIPITYALVVAALAGINELIIKHPLALDLEFITAQARHIIEQETEIVEEGLSDFLTGSVYLETLTDAIQDLIKI